MITKEDFIKKSLRGVIESYIRTVLLSKECADKFVARSDKEDIESEIMKISENVINTLVDEIGDRELTKEEFERFLKKAIRGHFGEDNEPETDSE